MTGRFVDVALARGQAPLFTYSDPDGSLVAGDAVFVPFGKRRELGLVLRVHDREPDFAVKAVSERPLDRPLVPSHLAELALWFSDYYLCPPGVAAGPLWSCAGPASLSRLGLGRRAPRKDGGAEVSSIVRPGPLPDLVPSPIQSRLSAEISGAAGTFAPFLMRGVTGSGKTAVFLLAARTILARGEQVLVLVPEIGLTPQTVRRTADLLGEPVAVLHSRLSPLERARAWTSLRDGTVRVALGPRSALFAPLFRPGLVVVDEEHDGSYKQSGDAPRYHGRDAAVWLGRRCGVPVVLASATPSLESWNNAETGRYRLLELAERAGGASLPPVELVDLRESRKSTGGALSLRLRRELSENCGRGEMAVLLHNRRGWAPQAACLDCGEPLECPDCPGLPLTWHRSSLVCHHCGRIQAPPRACPSCGSESIEPRGWAIQRVEDELHRLVPGIPVVRLDRDSTSRKGSHEDSLGEFARNGGILLGTQMVAKGHDFPGVTLVAATDADIGAATPDFRAAERTFQLLCQLSGRAGRADLPGKVLLQTRRPSDPLLLEVASHDFRGFAARELETRRILSLPPFSRMLLVEASAESEELVSGWIGEFAARLRPGLSAGQEAMGPMPAPAPVVARRHRFHLLCKSPPASFAALRRIALRELSRSAPPPGLRAFADVDPQDLL